MFFKKFLFVILVFPYSFAQNAPELNLNFLSDFHYSVNFIEKDADSVLDLFSNLIGDSDLPAILKELRISRLQDKRVPSIRVLKDRIKADKKTIYRNARKLGFYGAQISSDIQIININKVNVDIKMKFGRVYLLDAEVTYLNKDAEFQKKYLAKAKEHIQKLKASLADVKTLEKSILHDLQENGYPTPKLLDKRLEIDDDQKKATLFLKIDPQKKVNFGDVKILAPLNIKQKFIRNRIDWCEGEIFDIRKIESTAENLRDTQVFSTIDITPDKTPLNQEKIPMVISLTEDKKYMIDFSLLYSGVKSMNFDKKSTIKKGLKSVIARIGWTNYNTFGSGEKLSFIFEGTPIKARDKRIDFSFEVMLAQQDVLFKNNEVEYLFSRTQELTNVFFKKSDKIQVMSHYPILNHFYGLLGVNLISDYINSDEVFFAHSLTSEKYKNINVPIGLFYNRTDSLLDPTNGYSLRGEFEQSFYNNANIKHMPSIKLEASYYRPLDYKRKNILCISAKWRQIFPKNLDKVPVDKRIYAGGINSVRGYANQMATELIQGKDIPFGGKGVFEFNSEFRRKFSKKIGAVVFIDGARIIKNTSKKTNIRLEKKRWFLSTGIGFRYHTSIGPIRADFAFPIKKRKGVDSKMQFIMSLGQAF